VNNRADLPCANAGTAVSFGAPVKQVDIDIMPCATPSRAENFDDGLAVIEEVDVPFENTNDNVVGDWAAADSSDNVFGDEGFGIEYSNEAVDPDVQLDPVVDTETVSFEDPSSVAFAVAESDFVEYADDGGGSAAMSGATETLGESSGATVMATVLIVIASLAFILA